MMIHYFNEIIMTTAFDDLLHILFDVMLYWMVTRLWIKPILERVDR